MFYNYVRHVSATTSAVCIPLATVLMLHTDQRRYTLAGLCQYKQAATRALVTTVTAAATTSRATLSGSYQRHSRHCVCESVCVSYQRALITTQTFTAVNRTHLATTSHRAGDNLHTTRLHGILKPVVTVFFITQQ